MTQLTAMSSAGDGDAAEHRGVRSTGRSQPRSRRTTQDEAHSSSVHRIRWARISHAPAGASRWK